MEKFVTKLHPLAETVIVISEKTTRMDESDRRVLNGDMASGMHADGHFSESFCAKYSRSKAKESLAARDVRPSDPMFVLFTSGSTGQPKGIILEHSAICTHALVHGSTMRYHGARVLQLATHTFDVAIMDLFTTLLFGGCVCIPSEEDRKSHIVGMIKQS